MRPGVPRERRCCLRLKALGTVAAVGEAVPGHSQCRITVFLFPRLTWPLRRMHGDGRPSSSLGFLELDDHRGAVGSGPKPWAPPAAPGLMPWALTPVGPCGLQRARLRGPEPNPAAATAPADLWKCRCPRPPHLCCHIPKLRPRAESFEIASQLASDPAGASRACAEWPGSSGLRPVGAVRTCKGGQGGVWGSVEEMSESAELRVCAL